MLNDAYEEIDKLEREKNRLLKQCGKEVDIPTSVPNDVEEDEIFEVEDDDEENDENVEK